jgi:hypothetical protein
MRYQVCLLFLLAAVPLIGAPAAEKDDPGRLFASPGAVRLNIEVSPEGMKTLRSYHQVWGQPRPERTDVVATVREGTLVYTNVAIHLKGSYTFEPVDAKPSLTLSFDKLAAGQHFHGLSKVHLNNSVQDPSYLCEQLARQLFDEVGVPSPRAGHALVVLNGRPLGLYILVEASNKQFEKRYFNSTDGNLYDGGSGGDITRPLKVESGLNPDDRSDLEKLMAAAHEPDAAQRWSRLAAVLDIDRFISFAATETFLVHWDGYCIGANNYRVFHDLDRDKMVFMPHGLDQLFGTSSSVSLSITPAFKGLVARALLTIPEGRRRYLDRLEQLSTNQFRNELLQKQIDGLVAQLRPGLVRERDLVGQFDHAVADLKSRVERRAASVQQQLARRSAPVVFPADGRVTLSNWRFKPGSNRAEGAKRIVDNQEVLEVTGSSPQSSGSWRTTVLLDTGHYRLSGTARTEGVPASANAAGKGVILRISGERSTEGISITDDWKPLSYEFDASGPGEVEVICEFRGQGSGLFAAPTLQLIKTK